MGMQNFSVEFQTPEHYIIKDGKIEEEWMMYNEFEVMQQIYRE